jgi:diacylglycerol kinase (ATP)
MRYNHVRGLKHVIKAFGFSIAGFRAALRYEEAFRLELILFGVLAPASIWLGDSIMEQVMLLGSLFLVLITELMNSAVEAAVDRISEEHHDLAGRAKDLGSAAVFVALVNVVVIWGIVLTPKLTTLS